MTDRPKFVRAEQEGDVVFITPLFTYATFTEPAIASEWEEVQTLLDSRQVRNVIVDLGEIPYFGSTVLEWMSQLWRQAKANGGRLAVVRPSPIGREVLDAARLQRVWGIFPERADALEWFKEELQQPASH